MEKIDIKSLNLNELKDLFKIYEEKSFHAVQVYEWIHKKLAQNFSEMTNISKTLRQKLQETCNNTKLEEIEQLKSKDGTIKYLFRLSDGTVIESVLMRYHHGNSVCISSQAGCSMGCRFCASTLAGLTRNLTPAELLEQIYQISRSTNERISNIVVMGTGEPFDNYENLIKFIHMISDENGLNISQRNITVSTCGIVEKIKKFAEEGLSVTLALSLHASTDEIRRELMPIAKVYSISQVLEACDYYYKITKRRLTFEYSLIDGVNDREIDAKNLVRLLTGKNCHVNLIPVNPVKERDFQRSKGKNIQNFKNILEKNRINVTIRREMGTDIEAACGQLRKSYLDQNSTKGGEL